jgi:signal transduction histidine kinase
MTGIAANDGRRRVAARRAAFSSLRASRFRLTEDDRVIAMLPLSCRERPVGILEVLAPEERLDDAWDVLEVGASQLAVSIENVSRSDRLRQQVAVLMRASGLGAELVGARSADEAVRVAIQFVWDRFRVPVAGWYATGGGQHTLVEVKGVGAQRRRTIEQEMFLIRPWASLDRSERHAYEERFTHLTGVHQVSSLDGGDAVLLMGRPRATPDESLEMVGGLLADVLRVLGDAAIAHVRSERLDLGIAWTAHELRGPLLGIRAALEILLQRRPPEAKDRAVLSASLHELDQLTGSAEAILTWAAGEQPLDPGETDVVQIVEDVVGSGRLELGDERPIVVLAPEHAIARCDALHLRTVVSNLIRNAVAYSFRGTKVCIEIAQGTEYVQLSVSDEGPEIPLEERSTIFDPFVRGSVGSSNRVGSGLGLFIAKQVVEAHGGRIWVESERGATTFFVRLPTEGRRIRRFAS